MVEHRTGHEVRKVRHEQAVVHKARLTHTLGVRIHQKGDLGEGEERDADGQHDLTQAPLGARQRIDVRQQKARVLEVGQQQQVDGHTDGEPGF
ncbi:hypothetical protein D9M68_921160 [compost metagenome]